MTQGHLFETNAKEQGSLVVFRLLQVPCTDFIYPQRPHNRPAALIFSFCLLDRHQKAEHTARSQGQIYLRNKPFCEIDRKCSVMMQTVFGHPPMRGPISPGLATRAVIYRSLRALRTQTRQRVSKRVFWGVCKKVPENTPESPKIPQKAQFSDFWRYFGTFWGIFGDCLQTPKKTLFETFCDFGPETLVNGGSGRKPGLLRTLGDRGNQVVACAWRYLRLLVLSVTHWRASTLFWASFKDNV